MEFSAQSIEETCKSLQTTTSGLSSPEVAQRRIKFGYNEITDVQKKHWYIILLNQFKSLLVFVLLLAALLSFITRNHLDAYIILAVVAIQAT